MKQSIIVDATYSPQYQYCTIQDPGKKMGYRSTHSEKSKSPCDYLHLCFLTTSVNAFNVLKEIPMSFHNFNLQNQIKPIDGEQCEILISLMLSCQISSFK